MIPRRLEPLLRQSLRRFPAVGLVGSRQVGKTTLAKAVAAEATGSLYLDLERPADLARLREPEMYLELHQDELVILDEVQRLPGLPFFYRTSAGAEIDLVLTRPGRSPVAIEIKSTKAPAVSKGFRSGFEDLECKKGFVVYSGSEQFPLSREVTALPLGKLGVVFGE